MDVSCFSACPQLQIDSFLGPRRCDSSPSDFSFSGTFTSQHFPGHAACQGLQNKSGRSRNGKIVARDAESASGVENAGRPAVLSERNGATRTATKSAGVSPANGRESRMIPIQEALRRNSTPRLNGTATWPVNSATKNGALSSNIKGAVVASAVTSGVSSGPKNKAPKSKIIGSNGAVVSKSNLSKSPTKFPMWDDNVKVLPSDEGFSWSKENYSSLQRTIDVWTFVLSFRARLYVDDAKWTYVGGFTEDKQKIRRRKTASWVRENILQLGPTFIKLGQLSSTRSDLFPAEFVEELSKLQDRVPAFSSGKAVALVERELGQPIDLIFVVFEQQPIAAASLGQVHRAVLPNGEKVAVKIQRPGLKELFDIDLSNLKKIAEYFQNSETLGGPTRDWIGIYQECATILYQEIDYINEGRNADRFRRDYRNIKWVRVPQIFWDYTSRKVLTLEYVPGIKINDLASLDVGGYDRSLIARRAIESYLIQILRTGFFHADPHPGNLAIDVDGSLIYYDFGMMGEITTFTREKLLQMFYAVYEKDAKKVIQSLIDLGALTPTGDMAPVRRSIQFFLSNLMDQKPDQAATLSAIGEDLFAIALDQPFRFPATFTFVMRAFTTLEGLGYILNPDFSFAKIAAPYAQDLLDTRDSQRNGSYIVQELQRQATDARDSAVAMPMRIQRIDEFMQQLEAGDFKLRVRVLEAERAARRASILQMATIHTVAGATFLNIGVTLSGQGMSNFATGSFIGAGAFLLLVIQAMRRVQRLDKFEKMI